MALSIPSSSARSVSAFLRLRIPKSMRGCSTPFRTRLPYTTVSKSPSWITRPVVSAPVASSIRASSRPNMSFPIAPTTRRPAGCNAARFATTFDAAPRE